MKRGLEQLTYYDIFGYLLPGAVVVAAALVAAGALFTDVNIAFGRQSVTEGLAEGIAFALSAYIVGHLVQVPGRTLVQRWMRRCKWGGEDPSHLFLKPEDEHFCQQFKMGLRNILAEKFDVPRDGYEDEAFDTCRTYLTQRNIRRRVEPLYGLYAFSRGLFVAAPLAAACLAVAAGAYFTDGDTEEAWLCLAGMVLSLCAIPAFWYRLGTFREDFVDSVYRGFYVAMKRFDMKDIPSDDT